MDDPRIDPASHRRALVGLERINRLSRSAQILWKEIRRYAAAHPDTTVRVLDIATGSGDLPVQILAYAKRAGIEVELAGCDISPTAVAIARARSDEVRFFQADILTQPPTERWDIVTSSLFMHHLDTPEAEVLLRRMTELATGLILVNDLRRSRMGYILAWVVCRIVSRSPVVHDDGPVSVRGAWSGDEAFLLGRRLKLKSLKVERRWPCRFLLSASGS